MATHEALREDVMTLVRHVAAEFRRARPNYFDDRLALGSTVAAPALAVTGVCLVCLDAATQLMKPGCTC